MDVLVAYESRLGHAAEAGRAIADAVALHGVPTLVLPIEDIQGEFLDDVEGIIAGCWTPGRVPFGDKPTRRLRGWIDQLPDLDGVPVALFCTYRFFPRTFADTAARTAETLNVLSEGFAAKGARVLATRSINFRSIEKEAAGLTTRFFQSLLEV